KLIIERSQLPLPPLPPVPEFAVDKDRQPLRRNQDIGLARQIRRAYAKAHSGGAQSFSQQKLGRSVQRAGTPHDRGDFPLPALHVYGATQTDFTLVYCSSACEPRSRPKPLCLYPPNG